MNGDNIVNVPLSLRFLRRIKKRISELGHFCPGLSNWEFWSIINFFRAEKINSENTGRFDFFINTLLFFFKRARRKVDFANGRKKVDTMLYFTRQITGNGINKVPITRYDKICKSNRPVDDNVSTVYQCKCIFDVSRLYMTQMVILCTVTFFIKHKESYFSTFTFIVIRMTNCRN